MPAYRFAQFNIARIRAPLDSPQLSPFVTALEPINALADKSPGFVWRLQTDDGDATSIRAFDDDMLLVNMSVWESRDALSAFVYQSDHRPFLLRRREWFERAAEAFMVLWWVPADHTPTVDEAKQRLERLREHGPSQEAFTFQKPFPPPEN
jgi:uncharacterized protein DUF3291